MSFLPTISMTATKTRELGEQRWRPRAGLRPSSALSPCRWNSAASAGKQDEHQHHGDVLHDQPADGDPPALGLEQPPLLQHAQHHHGARDRERDAENETGSKRPAEPPADAHAERHGDQSLRHRARNGDGAHRQQVLGREVQADAEHQENDADLGELIGDILVGDEARRERPDEDAGDEIADERRQLEAVRDDAEAEGEHEAERDGGNERRDVRHETDLQRGTHR